MKKLLAIGIMMNISSVFAGNSYICTNKMEDTIKIKINNEYTKANIESDISGVWQLDSAHFDKNSNTFAYNDSDIFSNLDLKLKKIPTHNCLRCNPDDLVSVSAKLTYKDSQTMVFQCENFNF